MTDSIRVFFLLKIIDVKQCFCVFHIESNNTIKLNLYIKIYYLIIVTFTGTIIIIIIITLKCINEIAICRDGEFPEKLTSQ